MYTIDKNKIGVYTMDEKLFKKEFIDSNLFEQTGEKHKYLPKAEILKDPRSNVYLIFNKAKDDEKFIRITFASKDPTGYIYFEKFKWAESNFSKEVRELLLYHLDIFA